MEFKQLVITHNYLGFSNGEIKPCRQWLGSYNGVPVPSGLLPLLFEPRSETWLNYWQIGALENWVTGQKSEAWI